MDFARCCHICGDKDNAAKGADTSNVGANIVIADGSENTINGSYAAKIYKSCTLSEDGKEVWDSKKLPEMLMGQAPNKNAQERPEMPDGAVGGMMERPAELPQSEIESEPSEVFAIMAGGNYFTVH